MRCDIRADSSDKLSKDFGTICSERIIANYAAVPDVAMCKRNTYIRYIACSRVRESIMIFQIDIAQQDSYINCDTPRGMCYVRIKRRNPFFRNAEIHNDRDGSNISLAQKLGCNWFEIRGL